jgi:hypothetical protein
MDYRDDVERLSDRGWGARLSGGGNRRFENIYRRAAITLLEIGPSQPPESRESGVIIREGIPYQGLVPNRRVAPAALALRQLCLVDKCTYLGGFHLV